MRKDLKLPAVVLCDLDNTLYEYDPPHKAAISAVKAKLHQTMRVKEVDFNEAFEIARKEVKATLGNTASAHSRLLYFKRMIETLGLKTQPLLSLDLEQTYWRTFLSSAQLFPGVKEFFEELHCLNIPRILITDLTAQIQLRKLIYFELESSFDLVVSSEEVGVDKPDPRVYHYATSRLSPINGSIWMIGDCLEKDVLGSKRALDAVTFLRSGHFGLTKFPSSVDRTFKDFTDLLRILRSCLPAESSLPENQEDFGPNPALASGN
jgi:HAD superfamily hydrolase (TIGR01549 family)